MPWCTLHHYITFHADAGVHVDRTLQLDRSKCCMSGLVFNLATPLNVLQHVIEKVDMILLMSVNPGFGGQSFLPSTLDKLRQARKVMDESGRDLRLENDGGVKVDNIGGIHAAGPETLVAGYCLLSTFDAGADLPRVMPEFTETFKQKTQRHN